MLNCVKRFTRFGLVLHADKTRIVEFGRYAESDRRKRGDGKPETFNFLGFTHSCGKTRKGYFTVLATDDAAEMAGQAANLERGNCDDACTRLLRNKEPICVRFFSGTFRYYGVPMNVRRCALSVRSSVPLAGGLATPKPGQPSALAPYA